MKPKVEINQDDYLNGIHILARPEGTLVRLDMHKWDIYIYEDDPSDIHIYKRKG